MEDDPVQIGIKAIVVTMNECDRSKLQEAELVNYLGKVLARMRARTKRSRCSSKLRSAVMQ